MSGSAPGHEGKEIEKNSEKSQSAERGGRVSVNIINTRGISRKEEQDTPPARFSKYFRLFGSLLVQRLVPPCPPVVLIYIKKCTHIKT